MRLLHIVTVHPKIVDAYGQFGVLSAARTKKVADVRAVDLRNYAVDRHGSVDDHPYGGGDGMVLRPEPLAAAVDALKAADAALKVFLTTPGGRPWTHLEAMRWAEAPESLVFIAGRFGGVDQRFVDLYVDEEYSMGDVVLAGGELPALMMAESILRFLPGVLGHAESATLDSFGEALDGGLEHPLYTRPVDFRGQTVPDVLLSGDHGKIAAWRREAASQRTAKHRPDLARGRDRR